MSALTLLMAMSGNALAWKPTGWMWSPDQLPVVFYQTDYNEDSLPQTANPETDRIYQEDVLIKGFCNWHWTEYCDAEVPSTWERYPDAPCAEISFEYGGRLAGNEGNTTDGITKIYWDDPDDIEGAGVNGVTYTRSTNILLKQVQGYFLFQVMDSDIVFNDNIDWGTTEEIEESCSGEVRAIEATATHEIGHLLGMAHSCEEGELCTDDAFLTATMFWQGGNCSTSRNSINSDDRQGITAIYGPSVSFDVAEDDDGVPYDRTGTVPLEVCFDLQVDDATFEEISSIRWRWGDGTESAEVERTVCHTFEQQGQFTVSGEFEGLSDTCGTWESVERKLGYVLVCGEPQPAFEIEHHDGLTYQVVNQTNVDTYGCIDGISYSIYKGESASGEPVDVVGAWSPKLQFPEEGTYTVVLLAQGPAGEAAFQQVIDVVDRAGQGRGCSATDVGGGLGLAGLLVALGALVTRRRED